MSVESKRFVKPPPGVGAIVVYPLAEYMIAVHGWRYAWLVFSICAAVFVPLLLVLPWRTIERGAIGIAHARASDQPGMTVGEAVREWPFWALTGSFALTSVGVFSLVLGAVAMLIVGPQTVTWFGQGAGLLTGATVWVLGACLVVMAAEHWVRNPHTVEIAGGLLIVAGAAVTAMQSEDFGTVFGLLTAVALLAVGTMPDRVLLSLAGSLGLLVNVPWSINHFFPGEGRAPLLILVSGVVIVGVAVLLTRMGGRFRQLRH